MCGGGSVPELQLADDSAAFASVWRAFNLTGPAPPVDFSSWLVLGFSELGAAGATPAEGGGHCQIDGFALSPARVLTPTCRLVGNFDGYLANLRDSRRFCKHVLVVAIARGALPTGELALNLSISEKPYLSLHRFTVAPPTAAPKSMPPASATWRDVTAARDEVTSEFALPAAGEVGSDGLRAVWGDLAGDTRGNVQLCAAFEPSSEDVRRWQGRGWGFPREPICFERLRPRWLSYRPIIPVPESGPSLPTYAGPFLVELRNGNVVRLISLMQDRPYLRTPARRSASRSVTHCQSPRVERRAE